MSRRDRCRLRQEPKYNEQQAQRLRVYGREACQNVYFLVFSLLRTPLGERLHAHRAAVSEGPPYTRLPVRAPLWAHRALRPESLMLSGLSARTQAGFENPPSAREALRLTKCMCRTPLCSPCEHGASPPAAVTWKASDNTAHLTPSFHKQTPMPYIWHHYK